MNGEEQEDLVSRIFKREIEVIVLQIWVPLGLAATLRWRNADRHRER